MAFGKRQRWIFVGLLVLGAWGVALLAYRALVRARVTRAVHQIAAVLGANAHAARVTVAATDRVRIADLQLNDPAGAWSLSIGAVDVELAAALGRTPRSAIVRTAVTPVALRLGAQRFYALSDARAVLRPLAPAPRSPQLEDLVVRARELRAGNAHAPLLAAVLQLQLASAGPIAGRRLHGRASAAGPALAPLLALLGAEPAARWLVPEVLASAFTVDADLATSPRALELSHIRARAAGRSLEGALRVEAGGVSGALLLAIGARQVGLSVSAGALQPELAPDREWLRRQLERRGFDAGDGSSRRPAGSSGRDVWWARFTPTAARGT